MSSQSISNLREQFEIELTENPTLYHAIDIERVRNEEWQVKRYLLEHPDESEAFIALCKALQWKHSFGIHTRTDQYFPREFWELNCTEQFGTDKAGHLIQWGVLKHTKVIKEIALLARQFSAHCIERADRIAGPSGSIFVGDTKGTSFFARDTEMEKFQNEVVEYYPGLIKGMYIVDMPWLIGAILKLMMNFMPAKMKQMIHIVSADQLQDIIDVDLIPVAMNGTRETVVYPENLVPIKQQYKQMGIDKSMMDLFFKTYNIED